MLQQQQQQQQQNIIHHHTQTGNQPHNKQASVADYARERTKKGIRFQQRNGSFLTCITMRLYEFACLH